MTLFYEFLMNFSFLLWFCVVFLPVYGGFFRKYWCFYNIT